MSVSYTHLDVYKRQLSDYELKNKTNEFKRRLAEGETTDDLLPEAFAVCCEADYRVLGMFPYDVQILGGIALHLCYLCEMNTGEGKTLTATMPLYLNGLTGKSSILVTANEYLAIRDAEEMGKVYKFLGLSVETGVKRDTNEKLDNNSKKDVYDADIVYTTHGALGFDYLLNNLVQSKEDLSLIHIFFQKYGVGKVTEISTQYNNNGVNTDNNGNYTQSTNYKLSLIHI